MSIGVGDDLKNDGEGMFIGEGAATDDGEGS